jgi:hypothetical protein
MYFQQLVCDWYHYILVIWLYRQRAESHDNSGIDTMPVELTFFGDGQSAAVATGDDAMGTTAAMERATPAATIQRPAGPPYSPRRSPVASCATASP